MRVRLQGIFKRVEFLFVLYACVLNYRVVLLSVGILCVFMRIYIRFHMCGGDLAVLGNIYVRFNIAGAASRSVLHLLTRILISVVMQYCIFWLIYLYFVYM